MNIFFHKMRTGKKGQIVAVLTAVLIIFLIAAFTVVNLGKTKVQKVKVTNAAQAGVLAGGSAACVLLNSMANINDQMVLNFVGFTLMIQFLLISWMIDYVLTLAKAWSTLIPFNVQSGPDLVLAVMTLCLTTATIALMYSGATTVGTSIKRYILILNGKIPKNSRDSARQYAFSNAGVDEPKIPFSKSGCADAWCYSLLETGFDEFMRLLPAKNKADGNYGTSTIEYKWNDSRTQHIVENKVAVTVTPVPEVPLRVIKFSEVAANDDAINDYLNTQPLGILSSLIEFGVSIADVILGLIYAVALLIQLLSDALIVIAIVDWIWALAYLDMFLSCCNYPCLAFCWALAFSAYYFYIMYWVIAAAAIAATAAWAYAAVLYNNPPGDIPCFVWETSTSHPISTTVTRTTNPVSVDYKIYKTNWPSQGYSASGSVQDGTIFPPNQNFDIIPNF